MPLPGPRLYANSVWIGPANADNFMAGRNGYRSTGAVMHHSAGSLEALIYRFEHPPAVSGGGASAHFAISREEEVRDGLLGVRPYAIRYQLVDTADMAFADSNYFENLTTDAVEHVRQWGDGPGTKGYEPILDSQYASSHELLAILSTDEGWTLNATNVTPHNLYSQTTCPGDLDLTRIISGTGGADMDPDTLAKLQAFLNGAAGGAGQGGGYDFGGIRQWWADGGQGAPNAAFKAELDQILAHPAVVTADPQILTLLQQLRSKFA